MKSPVSSWTVQGVLAAAIGSLGVPAVDPSMSTLSIVLTIVGLVWALIGRWRKGDLRFTKPEAPPALLVLAVLVLTGCAGLPGFQSPGTSGAPATASTLAQTARDQTAVPGTSTGGTGSGNIYNQFAATVPSEVALAMLKVADENDWTAEQTVAAFKALAGAPTNVTIGGAQTNNVSGGDADNLGAGGSGAAGAAGGSTIARP